MLVRGTAAEMNVTDRLQASVCNVITSELPLQPNSVDIVLCMFVLSAIAPEVRSVLGEF
jgi:hypothetical protein